MPYDDPTDAEIGRFAMTAIDRVLTIAERVSAAYVAKLDREAHPDPDFVLPGEYAEPKTTRSEPPAGTPTGPRNPDGSFDEPVQRAVWMSPYDPRGGVIYRLMHAVDNSLALFGIGDPTADGPTVFDVPPAIASVNGIAPDANGVVTLAVPSANAASVTVVATDGTAIGTMASAPTPPTA